MARSDMKQKARTTTKCLHDVYNQVIAISPEFVQKNLTWKTMEPILNYHRNNNLPPVPTTIEEALEYVAFNDHPYKEYFQGYVTLGEDLALFFGDKTLIELMPETTFLGVDGTYKTRPQPGLFSQLYNVLVKFMGTPIPIAHILMTKKSEKFYDLVFEKLKRLGGENWVPEEITSDFEKAVLNSLKNTFPDANLSGCRFHFAQASYLRVQKHRKEEYEQVGNLIFY